MIGGTAGAEAVKLGTAAVVHFVKYVVLLEQGQCAEKSGFVHGVKSLLHLGQVERAVNADYLLEY